MYQMFTAQNYWCTWRHCDEVWAKYVQWADLSHLVWCWSSSYFQTRRSLNCSWSWTSSVLGSWCWGRAEFTEPGTTEKTASRGCVVTSWYCFKLQQRLGRRASMREFTSISCLGVPSTVSVSNFTSYAPWLTVEMAVNFSASIIVVDCQ
jgi:hypothetical protein